MKRILLISYNFSPEPTGIGKYNGEMINWLVDQGYDCSVITSYPYYPHWKVNENYSKRKFLFTTEERFSEKSGGKLSLYRTPMYVPLNPSGIKRMILDFSFFVSGFLGLLRLVPKKKFDLVVIIAPSFQNGLLGVLYKKLRDGKLLYHIQDMQIEAARDLNMIRSKAIINSLFKIEKYILKNSDIVTSISEEMVRRIELKANKKTHLFPNWADTKLFFPIEDKEELKKQFGFDRDDKIILYSGAIGEKQGLVSILYAAEKFKHYTNLKFVICGSGPYKPKLEALAQNMCLENIIFFPIQPFENFNRFLNMADVHLVIQKANASDLVMPSKLTSILAVGGLALITANKGSGLNSLIEKYDMGVLVEAENQAALNSGIEQILNKEWKAVKNNARKYAEQFLAIDNVMRQFENLTFEKSHYKVSDLNAIRPNEEVEVEFSSL
jgi:colanic acid biosynthesis glycosyl transferase WcaI